MNIESYLDEVEAYKGNQYFRGQANISWDITPSIFRDRTVLADEHKHIGEVYSNSEHKRILFRMLEMQHYGDKTRLCDLTVNPLVALFFAVDGDTEQDKDGCVFIMDSSKKFHLDSLEIKIMTDVATSDITSITLLKDEIYNEFGVVLTPDDIRNILFQNVVVEYGYEFAFSNPRSHLQGGTAIFFGYSSPDGEVIDRYNNYGIHNIIRKLIIPSDKKQYFLNELKRRGITWETLYDRIFEYRLKSSNPIKYRIEIDSLTRKPDFNKVVLWIKIDDIRFVNDDIFLIVDEVFKQLKVKYGTTARIFTIVYYDDEDKKAINYICHVDPTDNFMSFTIKWNKDYHKRRMEYTNHQISAQEIISRLEPIINEFLSGWEIVKKKNVDLRNNLISREEYCFILKELNKKLHKLAYWDSQEIAQGGDKIYDYQENGHHLIEDIMFLIEDQLMYLDRQANDYLLETMYENRNKGCENSYTKYKDTLLTLKI